ncbi:hypothetical protein ABXN37_19490 [Piscinibacter sakaiensis]|uniref:hypothetical protein n=1 Tax=Piscinibacter sakaiensis TaxID=1547922 RepID=UPI0012F9609C|nr:hypothetical protein [Piscinibacter sakaiensis]
MFLGLGKTDVDISVISLFLPKVRSQLRISCTDGAQTSVLAWNAVWDGLLLGAVLGTDVMCNLQSDVPAENLTPESNVAVTNYHLRGFAKTPAFDLSELDVVWIESHFESARRLLADEAFQNAVHCLATYRWHTMPRARLAVLWSGVEGLFGVDSEIVFRVSLYTALFLEPDDGLKRRETFSRVKDLYKLRSKAGGPRRPHEERCQ